MQEGNRRVYGLILSKRSSLRLVAGRQVCFQVSRLRSNLKATTTEA